MSFQPPESRPSVGHMNRNHTRLCPGPEWAAHMHTDVLPGLCAGVDLTGAGITLDAQLEHWGR